MIKKNQLISDNIETNFDDEIDLRNIFKFIFRNKFFIGFVVFLSIILANLYESRLKKIYKGEFQVVVNQKAGGAVINPSLGSLIGLSSAPNDLNTEIGILSSPSVLMPIFDYVLSNKKNEDPNFELVFNDWRKNNLNISLVPGTSILYISYQDEDKELIIPVLKRITSIYLEYSGRNKRENQELAAKYLRDQIKLFKNKSAESLKIAQEFAIDQDLIYFNNSNLTNSSGGIPNVEIESVRVKAANEIRKIDSQIVGIEEIGNDLQKLQYIGANIPEIVKDGLTTSLAEIEEQLVDKRSKYTEEDPAILRLVEKRDLLIGLLKKRSIGFLKAKKIETEALMQSAMRPKGVLLKYKELVREAQRNEATLVNLENQLTLNELNAAKFDTPWELITRPTLLKGHLTPNKKKIQFLGWFIGLLLGVGVSYFRESRSNKIYNVDKLGKLFRSQFIENLSIDEIRSDSMKINFLREFISTNKGKKIGLITSNEMESIITEKLIEVLINNDEGENIKIVSGIEKINLYMDLDIVLFVTKLDLLKLDFIIKIKDQLKLFNTGIDGIILVD